METEINVIDLKIQENLKKNTPSSKLETSTSDVDINRIGEAEHLVSSSKSLSKSDDVCEYFESIKGKHSEKDNSVLM